MSHNMWHIICHIKCDISNSTRKSYSGFFLITRTSAKFPGWKIPRFLTISDPGDQNASIEKIPRIRIKNSHFDDYHLALNKKFSSSSHLCSKLPLTQKNGVFYADSAAEGAWGSLVVNMNRLRCEVEVGVLWFYTYF